MDKEKNQKGSNYFFEYIVSFFNSNDPMYLVVLSTLPILSVLTSLEVAIGLSAIIYVVTILAVGLFSLISKDIEDQFRLILSLIITFTEVIIISLLIEAFLPILHKAIGMYIILIAVNMMILFQIHENQKKKLDRATLKRTLNSITKVVVFMLSIAFFRELIGTGEIKLGFILPMPFEWIIFRSLNLQSLAIPFILTSTGALFSIGFIILLYKTIFGSKRSA